MILKLFLFVSSYNLFIITNAHAYIDPGTISIIFQGIVGAIVAGGVAIKLYWHKFKIFFKKKKKDNTG
jgi:hypothetical protein